MTLRSAIPLALMLSLAQFSGGEPIAMQPFLIDHQTRVDGEADVSFLLDGPAGKNGFIRAEDGHLVKPNGERFRIWGVNLTGWTRGSMLLPPKAEASLWADVLARHGINCVRFHFLDKETQDPAQEATRRQPSGLVDRHYDDTRHLDPNQLDRLDFFVAQLKERGIYTNLNLNVGRIHKPGDGVPDSDVIHLYKGFDYIGPRLIELQKEYAQQLLTHYNPYTKNEYRHEPAVAIVEIVNENSITEFWCRNWLKGLLTADHRVHQLDLTPHYERILSEEYNQWLAANKTADELAELRELTGVGPGEPIPRLRREEFRNAPDAQFQAEATFYTEFEKAFLVDMKSYLQDTLGMESLVVGTADHTYWIPNLPLVHSMQHMDIVDAHVYWQHPAIWGDRNTPMVNEPLHSTIVKLSRSAFAGKPFTVSEVNHPNPNEYAAEMIPILASYAAFQDWDGIFFYTFEPKVGKLCQPYVADNFDITLDPVKMVQMAAGALLFSRADVQPAREIVARSYSAEQVNESMRLLEAERPYFTPGYPLSMPLEHEARIRCLDCEPTKIPAATPTQPYASDTGELTWHADPEKGGLVTIDTPRTQGLVGFVKANGISTSQLTAEVINDFCAITVSSLDSKPLSFSSLMLVTAGSKIENTGTKWNERHTLWEAWGTGPTRIEPVTGWLTLHELDGAVAVRLIPLDGAARPIGEPLRGRRLEDGWEVPLGNPATTMYLVRVTR